MAEEITEGTAFIQTLAGYVEVAYATKSCATIFLERLTNEIEH